MRDYTPRDYPCLHSIQGRADVSKVGDMPNLSDTDAYGAETARRVKKKLVELGVGTDKEVKTDVYFF
jgi:hypothetical protein